ncbi:hypothetical protein Q8F55_005791 [Vanrija albida]|uniref:Glycoside hydrolase family 5 domain-containing protein n=1 Tax=Vanrija albida TaxID=181172 RepID=A0ABR3Q2L0_9TREE
MIAILLLLFAALAAADPCPPITPDPALRPNFTIQAPAFAWNVDKVRGVTLGGWLVLEPWITPSLFASKPDWVVDEWTYAAYWRTQPCPAAELAAHWKSFYTAADFQRCGGAWDVTDGSIAGVGLNTVRIPIGYWSLVPLTSGEPYLPGAFEYLKLAVTWAAASNLKVIVDLYGAPGSQNGRDSSGRRGEAEFYSNWTNAERATAAVVALATEFAKPAYGGAVATIGLLHDPRPAAAWQLEWLRGYYNATYYAVRNVSAVTLLLGSAGPLGAWEGFMRPPAYQGVGISEPILPMLDPATLQYGATDALRYICGRNDTLARSSRNLWTVVEMSAASTDCARWLRGRGVGAAYDNASAVRYPASCADRSGSPGGFGAAYTATLGAGFETQTYVYEQAASGWTFCCWNTEAAADWSFALGLVYGWIPVPITAKPHGKPCNFSSFIEAGGSRAAVPGAGALAALAAAAAALLAL